MKKVLRVLLLLIIALIVVFGTVTVLNMISKGAKANEIVYAGGVCIIIIGMCIAFFVLFGKKKKD